MSLFYTELFFLESEFEITEEHQSEDPVVELLYELIRYAYLNKHINLFFLIYIKLH